MSEVRKLKYAIAKKPIPKDSIVVIGCKKYPGYIAYLFTSDNYYPDEKDAFIISNEGHMLSLSFGDMTHWDNITDEEARAIHDGIVEQENYDDEAEVQA